MALTKTQETAAELVADDKLTNEQIADRCKVTRDTIQRWKRDDEFIERVGEYVEAWRIATLSSGIACKEKRIERLNNGWLLLQQIQQQRGEHFTALRKTQTGKGGVFVS